MKTMAKAILTFFMVNSFHTLSDTDMMIFSSGQKRNFCSQFQPIRRNAKPIFVLKTVIWLNLATQRHHRAVIGPQIVEPDSLGLNPS